MKEDDEPMTLDRSLIDMDMDIKVVDRNTSVNKSGEFDHKVVPLLEEENWVILISKYNFVLMNMFNSTYEDHYKWFIFSFNLVGELF